MMRKIHNYHALYQHIDKSLYQMLLIAPTI